MLVNTLPNDYRGYRDLITTKEAKEDRDERLHQWKLREVGPDPVPRRRGRSRSTYVDPAVTQGSVQKIRSRSASLEEVPSTKSAGGVGVKKSGKSAGKEYADEPVATRATRSGKAGMSSASKDEVPAVGESEGVRKVHMKPTKVYFTQEERTDMGRDQYEEYSRQLTR